VIPDQTRAALRTQRKRKRRLVLLTGFALLVLIGVAVVVLLPKSSKSAGPSSTSSTGPRTKPGGSVTGSQQSSTTSTDPDAGLPALGTPTASDPLRVLEIGDSLGEDLGFQLQTDLPATKVATITMDSKGDTGLANVGYYDWPQSLVTDLSSSHAQILVVFMGANDGQGFDVNGVPAAFGTGPWITTYTQRVDQMLQESETAGARVVWVGMPPMQSQALNSEMQQIDSIFEQQTAKYPGAMYLSSGPVLAPGGQFTSQLETPQGEQTIRTPDGVHLTSAGAELLSQAVISAIDARWHLSLKS
jgi:uncharacterized protein